MSDILKTHHETILENDFIFDYRRGVFWKQKKVLMVTDLHWGKSTFFQKHGIAIPDDVLDSDLDRLKNLMREYDPSTVLILGDLIHHEGSLHDRLVEKIAHFRHAYPFEFILIKGNHDRYTSFPESWGIVEEKKLVIENFSFTHDLVKKENNFQFSGHLHPMMAFKTGLDFIRLPAFIIKEKACLLPAFSVFTGGQSMKLGKKEKAIVVYNDGLEVFENSES